MIQPIPHPFRRKLPAWGSGLSDAMKNRPCEMRSRRTAESLTEQKD